MASSRKTVVSNCLFRDNVAENAGDERDSAEDAILAFGCDLSVFDSTFENHHVISSTSSVVRLHIIRVLMNWQTYACLNPNLILTLSPFHYSFI